MTPIDVAVVGMAARLPGADDIDEFWDNLVAGRESITTLSRDQLIGEGLPEDMVDDPDYVPAAATMRHYDRFDAAFFGVSPREAELMDPQHRLFLQCCWHAMENAAIAPAAAPNTGVFAAANFPSYLVSNLLGRRRAILDSEFFELQILNDKDYLATRVAHCLGFTGPAESVQTACSSSLVAIDHACRALADKSCDLALAGGVCVRVPHHVGYRHERGMIFSRDGHCRPFDAAASGTVFGSGVGAVVLKRLEEAVADGNRILAVVKGSAVNNDGAGKVGYTTPSVVGQEQVVRTAHRVAGVSADSITAVEAHGTGTLVGDPIEVTALTRAFSVAKTGFCALGSAKSNIGHLETAAGVASFIKAVLQLQNRTLVATVGYCRPNPGIDLPATPFYVPTESTPWECDGPRRVGVSAFGIGGTNAHVVLEQAPPAATPGPAEQNSSTPHLVVLSAKSPDTLTQVSANLARILDGPGAPELVDVSHTLRYGRQALAVRRAEVLTAGDVAPLQLPRSPVTRCTTVVWMFPGQGSQYPAMASGLYSGSGEFASVVDQCASLLEPIIGTDIREAILNSSGHNVAEALQGTALAQPAIFVTSYALAQCLRRWVDAPDALVGHSLGEITAACVAGVIALPDALRFVARRGQLMADQPRGSMLAIHLAASQVQPLLPDTVTVAAVNTEAITVVAGESSAVDVLAQRLRGDDISVRELHTSHAFHSPMVDPILDQLRQEAAAMDLSEPRQQLVSAADGRVMTSEQACSADYWATHARRPVRFGAALESVADSTTLCVEVGPGETLCSFAGAAGAGQAVATMAGPRGQRGALETLLGALGSMWECGQSVDLARLPTSDGELIALPGYPFVQDRHWRTPAASSDTTGTLSTQNSPPLAPEKSGPHLDLSSAHDLDQAVIRIWEETLRTGPISPDDDFFELGGHSLMATHLSRRFSDLLGIPITLRDVMTRPTPASFANHLRQLKEDS